MLPLYETLLGHLKDHDLFGVYLDGDVPNWADLWTHALPMASAGERVMFEIGLALYNGHTHARIADILKVDKVNQQRIVNALSIWIAEF